MIHSKEKPALAEVLLVDDHPGDALLIQECLRRTLCPVNVFHVGTGEGCLNYLAKTGIYANAATPDLILLDLYLPDIRGSEVMKTLLQDERFRHLPVVALTTVPQEEIIHEMYRLRCSTLIPKPATLDELQCIIQVICEYWFRVATLPQKVAGIP